MTKNNKILPGGAQSLILLRKFFNYIKGVSQHQNRIQLFKRKLTEYLDGIQYTNIFKLIDINKKGKIEQKHLQQFLIINKHYHYPQSINRFFLKYSGQKHYLDYDDLLQSLLPHADYMTVSSTLLSLDIKRRNLFQQRANMQSLAALIISLQIQLFDFDYKQLKLITNLSYQRGVQLWRLLDKNHCNSVDFHTISSFSQQLGIKLNSGDWKNFLHHHFHIIKETISRDYFLKMVECLNQKIRIVNNLKIQRFIMTEQKRKLSVQQNFKKNKIQAIILKKLSKIQKDHLNSAHINPSFNMKKSQVCYQRDIYQNNNIPTQDKKLSVQNKSLTLNKTKQTVDMTATSSPNNTTSNYNSRRDKIDMKQKVSKSMNLTKRKENYKREFSQKKLLFGKIGYCNPKSLIKAAFFN